MKFRIIKILPLTLLLSLCLTSYAQMNMQPFEKLAEPDDMDYTYISADMLRNLGSQMIENEDMLISGDQLSSVRMFRSNTEENSQKIAAAVEKYIKTEDPILLQSKKSLNLKIQVYGKKRKNDSFDEILILNRQGTKGIFTTLTILTGNIFLNNPQNTRIKF